MFPERVTVLQIQTQAEAGGAQKVSKLVGEGLHARGYDVKTAFLYRRTSSYDDDPSAVFMLANEPRSVLEYPTALGRLVRYARRLRPAAIISYQPYGNIAGALAAWVCRVPLVANQNGMPGAIGLPHKAMLVDRWLGSAGAFAINIVNSAATERAFSGYPATYRSRLRLIEHGVERFESSLTKSAARRYFQLPDDDRPLILAAGRLAEQKNHVVLLKAIELLPDVCLAIAGNGPLKRHLVDTAASRELNNRVFLLGELPPNAMGDFFRAGDLFAFPSVTETFGLAAVEAAISGLPVVCSDLPTLQEVLATPTGSAACYVAPNDSEGFARAISEVLHNSELRSDLTHSAQALAERYSVEQMIDGYEACLQSVIKPRN